METTLPTLDRHDFFRIVGTSIGAIMLTNCLGGCGKSAGDPTPAPAAIDFTIDLTDNKFANLNTKGGYAYQSGVIIARTNADTFLAVAQQCTHENTTIVYQGANNRFYCPNHGSGFDTKGQVLNGPASRALIQYTVVVDPIKKTVRVFS